jgi:hypothetical protein
MVQQTIQTIATAVLVLFASPIAGAITPEWWYGLGACLSGVSLVMAFVFVPETKYFRPLSSFQDNVSTEGLGEDPDKHATMDSLTVVTDRPALDFVTYEARTWRSDLRLWVGSPEWRKGMETFIVSSVVLSPALHPNNPSLCAAIVPTPSIPQCSLGYGSKWPHVGCQHRHRHHLRDHSHHDV